VFRVAAGRLAFRAREETSSATESETERRAREKEGEAKDLFYSEIEIPPRNAAR